MRQKPPRGRQPTAEEVVGVCSGSDAHGHDREAICHADEVGSRTEARDYHRKAACHALTPSKYSRISIEGENDDPDQKSSSEKDHLAKYLFFHNVHSRVTIDEQLGNALPARCVGNNLQASIRTVSG